MQQDARDGHPNMVSVSCSGAEGGLVPEGEQRFANRQPLAGTKAGPGPAGVRQVPAADCFTGLRFDVRPVRYAGTELLRVAIRNP